ncbi:YdeI/OmpD-associated family protein [Pedobacter yulinensis]|nr:YdeI/OmpD-associated family protein [Pedobacter yulinensis]
MEHKVLKKLGLVPGQQLFVNLPPPQGEFLTGVDVITAPPTGPAAAILLFADRTDMLHASMATLLPHVTPETIFWVAYPKKSSGQQKDLSMMAQRSALLEYDLQPCASVSLDRVWTAVRLKFTGQIRRSGIGNADILKNGYNDYIDPVNRGVRLPEDLQAALDQDPVAAGAYHSLSYTNRKEYVIWLLSARQAETRSTRLLKTLEKLRSGKKNPGDK